MLKLVLIAFGFLGLLAVLIVGSACALSGRISREEEREEQ